MKKTLKSKKQLERLIKLWLMELMKVDVMAAVVIWALVRPTLADDSLNFITF